MAMGVRALVLCTCLAAAASTTSGALVSSPGGLQQQQHQHQRRQPHQHDVVGVVDKRRRGDSRLRGGASSTTPVDISHRQDPAQAAVAATRGGGTAHGGETAGPRTARERGLAVMSAAREDEPRENRVALGAQRVQDTIKQGVRNDDRNERTTQVPEKGDTAERVAVIAACIGAAIFFFVGWCWLSSLVVCVSWCVCKCANPRLGEAPSSGDNDLKHVDGYANAVRATFCGNLASVVCVSDEEAAPTSQPCTPQPGSDSIVQGSVVTNNAAANDGTAAAAPADKDATRGAGSNQSAFSAIFRRYLTATAVPPAIPAPVASTHDISSELRPDYPQEQIGSGGGNICGFSTAFCSTATDGGEVGGGGGEEKRSENAAAVASPQSTSRLGSFRLFRDGSGHGRGETDGTRGGRERTGWRARVWERLRSVAAVAGRSNPTDSVRGAVARVPWDVQSLERTSEGRLQIDVTQRGAPTAPAAGSLQGEQGEGRDRATLETTSHRRRTARCLAAGSSGRSCGRESRGPGPAVRDAVRNNSERDGGGADVPAGVAGSDTPGGNHDAGHLRVPEVVAVGAAIGAVAAENAPSGRSCSDGDGESRELRQEDGETVVGRTAGDSFVGGSVVAAAAAAARTNPAIPPASQHRLAGKCSGGAYNERGAGGGAEIEAGGGEDGEYPLGETRSKSPVLPRARVLWRAFSEVDHDTITENHRRAGLRHLARFAPAPGIENPPMCYVPPPG